ncbi:MAG: 4-hydroxy-tetrahydrodipicolinate reductase [Lachnospiraceae bacterium]|nr:4-hydroxy-tetrahydrodipicolinate reductase [Lachnospiraceae bacterium]
MTKIILNGCGGRMGKMITSLASSDGSIDIVAGVDVAEVSGAPFPVFARIRDCDIAADAVIDFSLPEGTDELLDYCAERSLPVVLCTTGLSEAQLNKVKKTSERVAVLRSANMSFGVNLLMKLLKEAAVKLAGEGFDIEIVEKHHAGKKDAPSGTAIALAESVNDALGGEYEFVFDRSSRSEKRPEKEIGISAVRGGTIPGDHDVIFAGEDEVLTFSHRAYSRAVFAKGALAAGKFLARCAPGLYTMADVIGD